MGEFKIAMKTLAAYETEFPQFKEILTLLQQSPLCERLSLASYLLTPIQRLPRYELLLKVSATYKCRHVIRCMHVATFHMHVIMATACTYMLIRYL